MHIALAALGLGLAGPPTRLPAFHTAARAPVARPSVVAAEDSQSSRLREEVGAVRQGALFVWPAPGGRGDRHVFCRNLAPRRGGRRARAGARLLVNLGVDLAAAIGTVGARPAGARLAAQAAERGRRDSGAARRARRRRRRRAPARRPPRDKLPRRVVIVAAPEAVLADAPRRRGGVGGARRRRHARRAARGGRRRRRRRAGRRQRARRRHGAPRAAGGRRWNDVVGTELATAVAQNADAAARGSRSSSRRWARRHASPGHAVVGRPCRTSTRAAPRPRHRQHLDGTLSRFWYWHVCSSLPRYYPETHHPSGADFNRSVAVGERGRTSGAAASSGTSTVNGEPSTWAPRIVTEIR